MKHTVYALYTFSVRLSCMFSEQSKWTPNKFFLNCLVLVKGDYCRY